MYSLMFPLPLYLIEMRFSKSVLVSDFSLLENLFLIPYRNSLVVFIVLDIVPLNAYGMAFLMIIKHMRFDFSHLSISLFSSEELSSVRCAGEETLNARSRSMTPRTIWRFSCHVLKFVPFSIGIELMLALMLETELVVESKNNKQAKQTHIRLKTKINSNKGKPHLKISDTLLIFYLWIKKY